MSDHKFRSMAQADNDTSAALYFPSQKVQDSLRFVLWLGWGAISFTVLATAFVVLAYSSLKQSTKDVQTALERFIAEKFEPIKTISNSSEMRLAAQVRIDEAQNTTVNAMGTQITAMLKQLEDWKPLMVQHTEMWFMEQNGISNQDAFFRQHGYYAPSDPRGQERRK